jgi:hypothetical protein
MGLINIEHDIHHTSQDGFTQVLVVIRADDVCVDKFLV